MDLLDFPGPIVVEFLLIDAVSGDKIPVSLDEIFAHLIDHNECEFMIVANWREKTSYETNKDLAERNVKIMLKYLDKMGPWFWEEGFMLIGKFDEVKPFPFNPERASCLIHLRLKYIAYERGN